MFYAAKSGCTSMRTFYSTIHADEFTEQEKSSLNGYHNLNTVFPFESGFDYSKYYTFFLSRNPYGRVVSAYIDQYAIARHSGVRNMLEKSPPKNEQLNNFFNFLQYLADIEDVDRDSHFQTQGCFVHPEKVILKKRFQRRTPGTIALDYVGDISNFSHHMKVVYKKIFAKHPQMLERTLNELANMQQLNQSYYSNVDYDDAASISLTELRSFLAPPRPQLFLRDEKVKELVKQIYADDFRMFKYDKLKIHEKPASPELASVPNDFDWQTYLKLNPDLEPNGVTNRPSAVRHYVAFGQYENGRFYKVEAPQGFAWQRYLSLNKNLMSAGINNEYDAIVHYLSFGYREGRKIT